MKKTMKRVLAFVLTFLMCASLAAPVFAADAVACPGANADHTKQNCSDYTKVGVHTPACGEQGYTVYECNTCGKYFADDIQENEQSHVWEDVVVAETCDENGYEGKVCKNCGAKHPAGKVIDNIAGHNWTSSIDCEIAGQVITVTCQNEGCGAKKDVVATGEHQWTTVPRIVKEPTCAVDGQGLAEYDCTVCGSVKQVVVYALKNHKNLVDVEAVEPDCAEGKAGNTAGQKCEVCGWTNVETLAPTHSFGNEPTYVVKANCYEKGGSWYFCTRSDCDYSEVRDVVPAYGHDAIVDGVSIKVEFRVEPTCQKNGSYSWYCALCDAEAVAANPDYRRHSEVLLSFTAAAQLTRAIDPSKGHDLKTVVVEPTCCSKGYTYDICTRPTCDVDPDTDGNQPWRSADRDITEIDPDKHGDYLEIDDTRSIDATCMKDGQKVYYCTMCPFTYVEVIPAAGAHDLVAGTPVAPMCGEDGYTVYTCQRGDCDYCEIKAGEKFDEKNPAHHDAALRVLLTGDKYAYQDGSCTVADVKTYKCPTCTDREGVDVTFTVIDDVNFGSHKYVEVAPAVIPTHCGQVGATAKEECERCHATRGGIALGTTKAAHNIVITVEYKAPTCQEAGNTQGSVCDCVFDIIYTEAGVLAGTGAEVKANDVYTAGVECPEEVVSVVIPKNAHQLVVLDSRAMDCEEFGYIHYECATCGVKGYIDDYVPAREHNYVKDDAASFAPTCDAEGFDRFVCSHDATHVIENVLAKAGHKDAEGNVIECVTEDFYCAVCAPESAGVKLSFKASHNFVVTEVPESCTNYAYTLYVCKDCEYFYEEYNNDDNSFLDPTTHTQWSDWYVVTPATYAAEGTEKRVCLACGLEETRTYALKDVVFGATIDNGVVAGADLVNSGLVALKVNATAYKNAVWGIQLKVAFDAAKVTFVEAVTDNAAFTVATGVQGSEVYVAAYAKEETADGKMMNVELNGVESAFVTLLFKVEDMLAMNTEIDFAITSTDVVDKDRTAVESSAVDVDSKFTSRLADINSDSFYTMSDAAAIMAYITEETKGYCSMADIDQNGKIQGADFAAFMLLASGQKTYSEIVAK